MRKAFSILVINFMSSLSHKPAFRAEVSAEAFRPSNFFDAAEASDAGRDPKENRRPFVLDAKKDGRSFVFSRRPTVFQRVLLFVL
jgi:hypothetical protein